MSEAAGHGGRREGAGRKPHSDRLERVTLYLGESQIVWLDEYTDRHGHTNLSQSVRYLIYEQMGAREHSSA